MKILVPHIYWALWIFWQVRSPTLPLHSLCSSVSWSIFCNPPHLSQLIGPEICIDLAWGNESSPKNVEFLDNKNIKTPRRINLTYTEKFQTGTQRSWWCLVLILVLSASATFLPLTLFTRLHVEPSEHFVCQCLAHLSDVSQISATWNKINVNTSSVLGRV